MQAISPDPDGPDWRTGPPEQALHVALVSVGRRLRAAFRTDPAAVGVLHTLACHGPLRVSALAEILAIDISTTSRHVSGLVADGHLRREPDPDDRRASLVTISPEGEAFLGHAMADRARVLREAVGAWPDEDVRSLVRLLDRLADDLAEEASR